MVLASLGIKGSEHKISNSMNVGILEPIPKALLLANDDNGESEGSCAHWSTPDLEKFESGSGSESTCYP